ncbi:MAG: amino acid synthesis family protein, partial [Nitrospira sp.]|nr:amino acid synthesis family protein [Nitrospira sp.]
MKIRKLVTVVEEILSELGKEAPKPVKRSAAIAIIENPFAGKYVEDLTELIEMGAELGGILGKRAVDVLGVPPDKVESYGKAAVVGIFGELEHAAAILHPKFGDPFRKQVGGGKAIIPSAKKVGPPATPIDIPLHYKDAAFVRSHFDAMEVR